jgi:glycosyltransferase involved in cell wall biosynthesis
MHVLQLELGRHLYGGARQVIYLTGGLPAFGVESTLVCPPDSAVARVASARGLRIREVPMCGDLDVGFVTRFRRLIDELSPDIVHVHSRRGADTLGGLAARRAGVPSVLTRRVDSRGLPIISPLKYKSFHKVIAISDTIYKQLKDAGVPPAKIHRVRSAVDPAEWQVSWSREQFLREFDLQDAHVVAAVIAQLIPRKGHRYLLDALLKITTVSPGLRVICFGRGRLENSLRKAVADAGLEDIVRFPGYRDDLPEFLGHCKLLVHPAVREGLGLGLLEAQAAGLPVVGFRVAGVAEAVVDGRTGVLVAARDSTALAAAMAELYDNQARREAMAVAGRDRIGTEFGLDQMIQGNLNVYREILQTERVDGGVEHVGD